MTEQFVELKKGEQFKIGDTFVKILGVRSSRVTIGVDPPPGVEVRRVKADELQKIEERHD